MSVIYHHFSNTDDIYVETGLSDIERDLKCVLVLILFKI